MVHRLRRLIAVVAIPPAVRCRGGRWTMLLVGALTLPGCPPPAPIPPPPPPGSDLVVRLEIVPGATQAEAGASFEIEARGYNAQDGVVPPTAAQPVTWPPPTSPALGTIDLGDGRALVKVAPGASGSYMVQAVMGGVTASATIEVHGGPQAAEFAGGQTDWLVAPQPADAPPAWALIRGQRGGVTVHDEFLAFVGSVPLGAMTGPGSVTVFRQDQPAVLQDVPWTTAAETVTLGHATPAAVPVLVWDAADAGLPANSGILATANLVLRANRSGIRLAGTVSPSGQVVAVSTADCAADLLAGLFPGEYDPDQPVLHVFVVTQIDGGAYSGYACLEPPGSPVQARAIFLAKDHNQTTLIHELGHQMALLDPAFGHTNCAAGFGPENVMWIYLDDAALPNRLRLSTGQVHRVTMDGRSWVSLLGLGGDPAKPFCDATGANCPLLRLPQPPPATWTPPVWCPP